ncbi:MAG TPA: hypothetical protein VMH01_08820 [Puia sp.]|nr:hypothetical protein [Puia sp.]
MKINSLLNKSNRERKEIFFIFLLVIALHGFFTGPIQAGSQLPRQVTRNGNTLTYDQSQITRPNNVKDERTATKLNHIASEIISYAL